MQQSEYLLWAFDILSDIVWNLFAICVTLEELMKEGAFINLFFDMSISIILSCVTDLNNFKVNYMENNISREEIGGPNVFGRNWPL